MRPVAATGMLNGLAGELAEALCAGTVTAPGRVVLSARGMRPVAVTGMVVSNGLASDVVGFAGALRAGRVAGDHGTVTASDRAAV